MTPVPIHPMRVYGELVPLLDRDAVVIGDGGFDRLRLCARDDCDDVFVDASRNRSRRFCDPATCGNRAHVAAYRARQRSARAAGAR